MSFQQHFDSLAKYCKIYHKRVDENELWYEDPFQERYLLVNKLIEVHLDSRLALEALAAGEQSAPGFPSLTPARRHFYELQEEVPSFLASGSDAYYYLQHYRIDCTYLLKTFSYSTFKGDWDKSRELIDWMGAINNKQESHNASSSLEKSLEDIKDLGDISSIQDKDLRLLEEEVRNIQTLLLDNPDLEGELSEEDLAFIRDASEHLNNNKEALKGIPEIDDSFQYEEPPALEALSYRCRQLAVLVDNFKKDFDPEQLVLDIDQFKRDLKSSFDLTIDVCADVYRDLLEEFGAYKVFTLRKLCDTMHDSFERFSDEKYLQKRYSKGVRAKHMQVHRGIPDTITMETYVMLAMGTI
ncbi:MAG: hypothetical protein ACRBFS_09875 [Aureispira sp.]